MNTTTDWGVSRADFENNWVGNTIGSFKVQASIAKRNGITNTSTEEEINTAMDRLFNAVATNAIRAITSLAPSKILKRIKFEWLPEYSKGILREGVYEFIQDSVLNRNVWQRSDSSQLQSNAFQINSDTSRWLLSIDQFNQFAKNLISESKISQYKVHESFEDAELYIKTAGGNIQIVGYFDDENIQELI